ncbi:MAG: phosphoadenosine phosphosulfate reductase family protein [Methanomicrobiaceae archaeon]|uniref:Pua-paps reductase like fusion n=1 Tax=hydrocarbon metagenome TaxID=938273 RepID=A0A0W8FH95_9ZZZZ|nr:phosphoadenosine phosphosulfate reductase family protein [Methanomicrobiaceae archaeon]
MPRIYLGKIPLHWCDRCHVPVLAGRCGCGAEARPVPVTPPGDARPAFEDDIAHINRVYRDHFGSPLLPDGHIVLLNKVPSEDRMDEIILGGAVVGAVRYLPGEDRWEPLPRPCACMLMKPQKRYVIADDGAIPSISEGASLLAPGLVRIDPSVAAGDEVFIMDRSGGCIGVGRARVDAAAAAQMERGVVVRTRKNLPSDCVPAPAGWDLAVEANAAVLAAYEEASVQFVREVAAEHPLPLTVSYSGGKDSLATLLVVLKAVGNVPLIFADTGLEFPETYENVREVAECYGLDVVRIREEGAFFEALEREGPPAVDLRWCCRVCKLHPVSRLIEREWGECLSFIGQRKYESVRRWQSSKVWRNAQVKNQVSAAPIQQWTAMHVWLYLFRERAPYNRLYRRRLDRIGCFMCPSSDIATLRMIEAEYPELWRMWREHLEAWREKEGLPAEWVSAAGWRRRGGRDEADSYN